MGAVNKIMVAVGMNRYTEGLLKYAVDIADALVGEGIKFDEAHEVVGALVREAERSGLTLFEISPEQAGGVHASLPLALENTRVAASRKEMPSFSACSWECLRTKFISSGSSACAASKEASANIRVCSGKRSRKIPDSVMTTSMRGRPSSSSGMSSAPASFP